MTDATPQFVTKSDSDVIRNEVNITFFNLYSEVSALSKTARKTGQAIQHFHDSRAKLENELKRQYSDKSLDDSELDGIAVRHSLLALVHWLYPNYVGYNRLRNAKLMYQHAIAATSACRSKTAMPYVIGLMIQLRITPFLIKSKKSTLGQLTRARETALKFISKYKENVELRGSIGLMSDGLGFSYFLLERDTSRALSHISKAAEYLVQREKDIRKESSGGINNPTASLALSRIRLGFYRAFVAAAYWDYGLCYESQSENAEGGEMVELSKEARVHYERSYSYARQTPWHIYKAMSRYNMSGTYAKESLTQVEKKKTIECLKKAVSLGEDSLKWFGLWSTYEGDFLGGSWIATFYQQLANYSDDYKRKRLMTRSLVLAQKAERLINNRKVGLVRYKLVNIGDIFFHNSEYYRQLAIQSMERIHGRESKAIELLNKSLENCLMSRTYYTDEAYANRIVESCLLAGDICFELINCEIGELDKRKYSRISKRYFIQAIKIARRLGWNEKIAESSWRIAQVFDKEGNFPQSAFHYLQAHEAYEAARISNVNSVVYSEPSSYMLAWTNVERAKIAHKASEFGKASEFYRQAANLMFSTRRWRSRAHLCIAESMIEKSEEESLSENTQNAIKYFIEACRSLANLQAELKNGESGDSRSFLRIATQMNLFSNARIILEKSKESYRIGEVEQSIRGLTLAGKTFSDLAKNSAISDSLRSNELNSLAALCKALASLQSAQIGADSKLYLVAQETFGNAALDSKSRTLKPLLSGLASFARFLYYSKQIERSLENVLDIELLVECNRAIDSAEMMFRKLGNKSFLNMLKASKYILDATIKMNAAEREMESSSVKAKLYSEAQRSLSRASRYYQLLGSSKRVKELLKMSGAVKHNQKLIPLANDIIAEIASNQLIYTAISNATPFDRSPENTARELDSAFVVLDLNIPKPFITLGDVLVIDLVLSNIGKQGAISVKIEDAFPERFQIIESQHYSLSKDRSLILTSSAIGPGYSKKISVSARPESIGEFVWHPALVYLDGARNYRITKAQTAKVVVESSELIDLRSMLSEKEKLESELHHIECEMPAVNGDQSHLERVYSIRENISRIEEEILRIKNDYEKLILQLDQIRADMSILSSVHNEGLRSEDKTRLEDEERLLIEMIERRRSVLEQAHLL